MLLPEAAAAAPARVFVSNVPTSIGIAGKICVDGSSASPMTFALLDPDGSTIESAQPGQALTTACDGSAGTGFVAQLTSTSGRHYAGGAIATASQDGVSVSFPLPFAAYSAVGSGPDDLHVRSLPDPATVSVKTVLGPTTVTGGSWDDPSIASGDRNIDVAATLQGSDASAVPYAASVDPDPFHIDVSNRQVTANGLDPLGPPATVTLYAPDGTTLLDQITLVPRVDEDTRANGLLAQMPPAGSSVRIDQAGWFSHTVKAGAAAFTADGFSASAPADQSAPGAPESASLDPELAFSPPPTALCPAFASTLSCTVTGQFTVPGDTVTVTALDPDGDSFGLTVTRAGSTGSLDDGSYLYQAGVPNRRGTVSLRSGSYREDGDAVASDDGGLVDVSDTFATHVMNGARVTAKGAAFGSSAPPAFTYRLSYTLTAAGITGSTYPGGRVALTVRRGVLTDHVLLAAGADGTFTAPLANLRPGDRVDVVAADPATHDTTTSTTWLGALQPQISGLTDGQAIRGTIRPTITGAGIARVAWSGDPFGGLFPFNAGSPPFTNVIDTRAYDDGTYRLMATAEPAPSATDYLYVTIDNTPPDGSAGPSQTVAPGRKVVFVTGAADETSGLASVTLRPGDGSPLFRQAAGDLGNPIYHIYRRTGRFTAVVTMRDAAGNTSSARTRVTVTTALTAQVTGTIPAGVRHGRRLTASLSAGTSGDLLFQVLDGRGKTRARAFAHFLRGGRRIGVSFPTASLPRGTYTVLLQFTNDVGTAGPVVARRLVVR
jgi:hypothetical protein